MKPRKQQQVTMAAATLFLLLLGLAAWSFSESNHRANGASWVASHPDFRLGLRKMEILGCLRTNQVVTLDLGWWSIQHWKQGGTLPSMHPPSP